MRTNVTRADSTSRKPSICLVAHFAYGVLSGGDTGHIGGVERQTTMMARWLTARGYRVTMITWDEGQPEDHEIDGIRVIKLCSPDGGLPGLRFFHPRWTSLVRAMRRANADVYYQNCAEYVTGQVALWCRRHGRRFVYSIASDPDCDAQLPKMQKAYERELYRYGLLNADGIVVQTVKQQDMLRDGFQLDSVVIPMPCTDSQAGAFVAPEPPDERPRILWVGRIAEVKRLEWLLDMAAACLDFHFDVVGPSDKSGYAEDLVRRGESMANVTLHGRVHPDDMPGHYRDKAMLCCTSHWEGFPNTFLEAWNQGIPVVSTVDPDGRITELGLGAVAQDVGGLMEGIRALVRAPDRWRAASRAARAYIEKNHALDVVLPRFEHILFESIDVASTERPSSPVADLQHA